MAGRGSSVDLPNSPPSPSARYAYLVARLRNRLITMEEAIELFALMDDTIRMLRTTSMRAPPAVARPSPAAAPAPPPSASGPTSGIATDDLLTAGVLMIGAGAGIAAALRRRAAEGPRTTEEAPRPSEGASSPRS